MSFRDLEAPAARIAQLLIARKETVGIAESSTGGLVSAALLAVPGASAFFMGGSVIYTRHARRAFLGLPDPLPNGMRPSTEQYAIILAEAARQSLDTTWGLGESGAAGPTGNRYGDKSGHSCLAVAGPIERLKTVETGSENRDGNMWVFALEVLTLFEDALRAAH